jgi:Uma2 family endonuclease
MSDPAHPRLSVEAFEQVLRQRGHDRHIELIEGEIVEKMPNEEHGYLVMELGYFLRDYLKRAGFGRVVTEVRLRIDLDGHSESRLPDLAIFRDGTRPIQTMGHLTTLPDIVVEVQSPDDSRGMLIDKADLYLAAGIDEVWLVLPHRRMIEVVTRERIRLYQADDALESPERLPAFRLPLPDLFTYPRDS